MKKVFDTHMLFLQINQSAAALKHVFAALRLFVGKVTMVLFYYSDLLVCYSKCSLRTVGYFERVLNFTVLMLIPDKDHLTFNWQ